MSPPTATKRAFVERRPDPERFWIRYTPRGWPVSDRQAVDLATGRRLTPSRGRPAEAPEPPAADELARLNDLVYLPAVDPAERGVRDRWLTATAAAGTPALCQLLPGEHPARVGHATFVLDLLESLVSGEWPREAAPATIAVWPLIAGWSDRPPVVAAGLAALDRIGLRIVVPLVLELDARQLRELAERVSPEAYGELFHAPAADRRGFTRAASALGLETLFDRPLPAAPGVDRRNRWLAGQLLRIGELRLALGRPEVAAQGLFRAARWVDEAPFDVTTVAAEGNLGVVEWLDTASRQTIEAVADPSGDDPLRTLEAEYLAALGADEPLEPKT